MRIEIHSSERLIGQAVADNPREDLPKHYGDRQCGFVVQTSCRIYLADIQLGKLKVFGITKEGVRKALPYGRKINSVLALIGLLNPLEELAPTLVEFPEILEECANAVAHRNLMLSNWISALGTIARNPELPPQERGAKTELMPLSFPVGVVSGDGTAVLGRGGYVFLTSSASNDLETLFRVDPPSQETKTLARGWCSLFRQRRAKISDLGGSYLQVIVPEKNSIVSEKFPLEWRTPSHLLTLIENELEDDPAAGTGFIPLWQFLRNANLDTPVFQKADSHLTPYGSFLIFSAVMRLLGLSVTDPAFNSLSVVTPDLAARFFGCPFYDELCEADFPDHAHINAVETVERFVPIDAAHIGRRLVTTNQYAPFALKLLAVGNSFCEFEEVGQSRLSWWFARWFREYHFLWNPSVDYEYIETLRPDVIVCQTIERYLPSLPTD